MARRLVTAADAFDHVVGLLEHFDGLGDPRQRAKVLYPRDEVLLACRLGVLAGCESWVEEILETAVIPGAPAPLVATSR